jgi:hypothetical protein
MISIDRLQKRAQLAGVIIAASLTTAGTTALAAPCTGPGAPTTTETKCKTAIVITGVPLQSYDISWVDPQRGEYYLADRSNKGIDVIDTKNLTFKRTITGSPTGAHFVGVVLNAAHTAVDNNHSGPDGVVSHGRWLYAGDGDSTLKVIDLEAPNASAIKQTVSTGGTTRLDEMALTTDGRLLLAANNAEDPPFGTMFVANGDSPTSHVAAFTKILIDPTIVPPTFGLSIEQPAWDPKTERFYVSVPIIANNPSGCNYGQINPLASSFTCSGGLLVINPATLGSAATHTVGAFNPTTNEGVVPLNACGPNGATVGAHDNLLLGCTPANLPSGTTTLVINAKTKNFANISGIVGSDEVWYNSGDFRYYTASNRNCKVAGSPCPATSQQAAVLGVIDATSVLIETIPQSSGSHSVAADSARNLIFVPESAPFAAPVGGDTTMVGAQICGGGTGCIAVYIHNVDNDEDHDHGHDGDHDHDHH